MKIIYPAPEGNVAVMVVNKKFEDDLVAAGKKLVPEGLPFMVIQEDDLPDDDTFFDAWEADWSNPDGMGELK